MTSGNQDYDEAAPADIVEAAVRQLKRASSGLFWAADGVHDVELDVLRIEIGACVNKLQRLGARMRQAQGERA